MKFNSQLLEYIDNTDNQKKKYTLQKMRIILQFVDASNLSESDINDLESEIETYNLYQHKSMSSRALRKKLKQLQRFVNQRFNFTHKGYYMAYFMAIGMTLGLAIGSAVFDTTIGLSTGMMTGLFIGSIIGRVRDQNAEKNDLVYDLGKGSV